ncbi:MAG: hypothetical protein ABI217_04430 [Chthoniobacterales bacterium]
MAARPNDRTYSVGRICLGALLALAVLIAALLSAAPALHERLHSDAPATHLCVVTLFASGHCEAVSAPPVFVQPEARPLLAALPVPLVPSLAAAHFFALLEHAPPVFA